MFGDLDTSKLDFALSALLEKKLLDFIIAQGNMQSVIARGVACEGFASAQEELGQAEEAFRGALEKIRDHLDAVRVGWEAKRVEAEADLDRKMESLYSDLRRFQGEVDKAHSAYNALVANTERDAVKTVNMAQLDVRSVETGSIDYRGGDLDDTEEEDLNQRFCNVLGAQDNTKDSNHQTSVAWEVCGRASFYHGFFGVQASIRLNTCTDDTNVSQYLGLLTAQTRKSAQKTIGVVKTVVEGAGHMAAKIVIRSCKAAWEVAGQVASVSANGAITREVPVAAGVATTTRNNTYGLGVAGHLLCLVRSGRREAVEVAKILLNRAGNALGLAKGRVE